MRRTLVGRKKPAMSTTAVRRPARIDKAEKAFVKDLTKILGPVLAKMTPAERQERLKKLKAYLSSLDESVAKRA
jgi:hypothetical protein